MNTALQIDPNGQLVKLAFDSSTELEVLQAAVGGYIEHVGTHVPGVEMFLNEEGKLHELEYNPAATLLAQLSPGDYIAGPAVLTGGVDANGNMTGLGLRELEAVSLALLHVLATRGVQVSTPRMDADPDTEWSQAFWDVLQEGGTWGVPRSGLMFQKLQGELVLTARMPWQVDMPCSEAELDEIQEADYQLIREKFEAAGVTVRRED